MTDLNKKVNELIEDIQLQSKKENKTVISEISSYKESTLEEFARACEVSARKYAVSQIASGKAKIASELSEKHMTARGELVKKRSEMTDEVIRRAGDKLIEFTKTDDYPKLLRKSVEKISQVLHSNRVVLCVKPDDMKFEDMIKEAFGRFCTVESDDSIVIGGIKGYDRILFKLADETLDGKLADQREYFVNNSGLTISVR